MHVKVCEIFYKKNTATLQILQKIRWSPLYFNRETLHTMAYEILNGRKGDLWDKIKEVKFLQLFSCELTWYHNNFLWAICTNQKFLAEWMREFIDLTTLFALRRQSLNFGWTLGKLQLNRKKLKLSCVCKYSTPHTVMNNVGFPLTKHFILKHQPNFWLFNWSFGWNQRNVWVSL
jgi:hypothetical protein